jgi:soluble P-type ATPase
MIELDIPALGQICLKHLVLDYSGTLSVDGRLLPEVASRLALIAQNLEVHIITSDTHGRATEEMRNLPYDVYILRGDDHSAQKEDYVRDLGIGQVIAIGNGNNDAAMLKAARIGIVVCLEEGCAARALASADVFVKSIENALDLLLKPNRLIATLRK